MILLFVSAGCVAPGDMTPAIATQPVAQPSPSPAATPTAQVATEPSPSATAETVGAAEEDVSVYLEALQPEAAADVDLDGMTRYRMDVTLSPDLSLLSGNQHIRYSNREDVPLERFYLHLYPNLWGAGMTISDVLLDGMPAQASLSSGDDLLEITFQEALPVGESIEVSLEFSVPVPSSEEIGNYGEFAYRDNALALAHFYPTVAVYDEGWHIETPAPQGDVIFHDASLYDVRFTAPEELRVAATGTTVERVENADGSATWRFAGGPMRDFNIAASADYRVASGPAGDVTVNSYYLPGDEEAGRDALEWASAAVETFETIFGPYPYVELDVAATGTTAAGIEYPGLIVIAAELYDRESLQPVVEAVVAHETAHQWWYAVVGNDQVNDPWLDEALAQYSTYRYFEDRHGAAGGEGFRLALEARWQSVNRIEKPVGLPVGAYPEGEYSALVYGRGALFLIALEERIGQETMDEFLQRYYQQGMWGIATPEAFQALAEQVSGQDLDDIFDEWVYAAT